MMASILVDKTGVEERADRTGCGRVARSGEERKAVEPSDRLVEVAEHDHLMHADGPVEELSVQLASDIEGSGERVVDAGGHVRGHDEQAMTARELEHHADESTGRRYLVRAVPRSEVTRQQQADAGLVI